MKTLSFNTFAEIANAVATENNCTVKTANFISGAYAATFEVDKFGGIAAIVKYDGGAWYINESRVAGMVVCLAQLPALIACERTSRERLDWDDFYALQF